MSATDFIQIVILGTAVWYAVAMFARINYLYREGIRLNQAIYEAEMRDLAACTTLADFKALDARESRRHRWEALERKWKARELFWVWLDYEQMYPTDYIMNGTKERDGGTR